MQHFEKSVSFDEIINTFNTLLSFKKDTAFQSLLSTFLEG